MKTRYVFNQPLTRSKVEKGVNSLEEGDLVLLEDNDCVKHELEVRRDQMFNSFVLTTTDSTGGDPDKISSGEVAYEVYWRHLRSIHDNTAIFGKRELIDLLLSGDFAVR